MHKNKEKITFKIRYMLFLIALFWVGYYYTGPYYRENTYMKSLKKGRYDKHLLKAQMNVGKLKLSDKGQAYLKGFIQNFYKAYAQAIQEKNIQILENYFEGEYKEKMIEDFKAWFIAEKNIQEVNIKVQRGRVEVEENGRLKIDVQEKIFLTNSEYDKYKESQVKRVYQILLTWVIEIDLSKTDWKIRERMLKESVIAYRDDAGKWIQY